MDGQTKSHSLSLENRTALSLSGVSEVIKAESGEVLLNTTCGRLLVEGKDIKIKRFNESDGSLTLSGEIALLKYEGEKIPFLKRIFR